MQVLGRIAATVLPFFVESEQSPRQVQHRSRSSVLLPFVAGIAVIAIMGTAAVTTLQALPATFTVNNNGDAGGTVLGSGSLRQAINTVNTGTFCDPCTIVFDGTVFTSTASLFARTINLTGGPLPAITQANVTIDGFSGNDAVPNSNAFNAGLNTNLNVTITSTQAPNPGLVLNSSNIVVRGIAIRGNFTRAIEINGANAKVQGSLVGLDDDGGPTGLAVQTPIFVGISATGAEIGGALASQWNVISGGTSHGIDIQGQTTTVRGNYIGVHKNGTAAGNGAAGINVAPSMSAANTIIGDATIGNLISANAGPGILVAPIGITPGTIIRNNIIGLDPTGSFSTGIGNGSYGIDVTLGSGQTINNNRIAGNGVASSGLVAPAASGSAQIRLTGSSTTTTLTSNVIGTNSIFSTSIAPVNLGILIESNSTNNTIGTSALANSLGGRSQAIRIDGLNATGNVVGGVLIGDSPLTANTTGVYINGSPNNRITSGASISNNTGDGVVIDANTAAGNQVLGASIHTNGGIGIDLDATSNFFVAGTHDGPTPNDATDSDQGPAAAGNDTQNHPIISTATLATGLVTATVSINSSGATGTGSLLIELFQADAAGTGSTFFLPPSSSNCVAPTFTGPLTFSAGILILGDKVLATATNYSDAACTTVNDGTSEFSPAVVVTMPPIPSSVVVTNINDSGPGSLRQAILDANSGACPSVCIISFSITPSGPQAITPATPLPSITAAGVQIDGTTQFGFIGSPIIEIIGSLAGAGADGLRLQGGNSTIRGLVINRFLGDGIEILSAGNTIVGNFIGTNLAGGAAQANTLNGILINNVGNNIIGTSAPGDPNLISGNGLDGILMQGASASNNFVRGNIIGAASGGPVPIPNGAAGVGITSGANNNRVGDASPFDGNLIAFNSGPGVKVLGSSTQNAIRRNSIHLNAGLGIDLDLTGVTANDTLDPDAGPNGLQNFPVLTSATFSGGNTTISGTINTTPSTAVEIDWFASAAKDPTNFGEGQNYLGTSNWVTDASGNAAISIVVPGDFVTPTTFISATASTTATGTSEFAAVIEANLAIVKTDAPDPVAAGGTLVYTLAVSNAGPSAAAAVSVVDTLPAGVTFLSATGAGFTCGISGSTVTCTNPTFASGAATNITITVTAPASAGLISNSAIVSASTPDPNTADNNSGAVSTVSGSADLGITKTDSPDPVTVGANVTYTITVTNAGPSSASNVSVTDTLPATLTHVSSTSTQGSCGFTSPTVTCAVGTLLNGGTATITIIATANTAGTISNTASVSATDSDPNVTNNSATATTTATPTLSINNVTQAEGNAPTNFVFTVTLSQASAQTVTVNFASADGSATAPGDYAASSGTLTFTPGATTQTITVPVVGDTLNELNETFTVNLSTPANATIATATGTGTIQNDDAAPVLSINNVTQVEGNAPSNFAFTVTLSQASAQTVTVNFASADGTATTPGDYAASSGTLTFTPGATTQTITVPVVGDTINEPNETFTLTLSAPANATLGTAIGTGTIQNDDAAPVLSINNVTQAEGNVPTNFVFTVTLSQASAQTVTVNFASADGSATAPADYTALSGSLTFNPGVTTQTITVPVVGDTLNEPNETFTVNLSTPANATIATATGTGTIQNDDAAPVLSINNVTQAEGNAPTNFVFTVTLSQASAQTVTVNFASADGSATAPGDYAATSGTLTFAPGATTQTITVPVVGDTLNEPNETFTLTLSAPANATLGTATGTGTIQNDDAAPVLSINNVTQAEGNAPSNFAFTVSLSQASAQTVTVNFASADGTATTPGDYTATSGSLTFAPGATTQTITVPVVGDTINEPNETFTVILSAPANATLGTATGTGTIQNDDAAPVLSINNVTQAEGNAPSTFAFTVTLTPASAQTVTVSFASADGTATTPGDYAATSGSLTFNPGATTQTITVPVVGDTINEPNETFTLTLSAPANATLGTATGTGTIQNDDGAPLFQINNVTQAEGNTGTSSFLFSVTLSQASAQTVTANYASANGTATAPGDYAATSGTLTFAPGVTTQTITVPVVGDTINEPNETFTLTLSAPANAILIIPTGLGTIQNDDVAPVTVNVGVQKSASPAFVTPLANFTYTIVVKNSEASSGPATNVTMTDPIPADTTFVSVSTTQGTCTTTTPITCSIGTLAPGSSATVTLLVKARAAGTVSNTASVTSTELDSDMSNNRSTATSTANGPLCAEPRLVPFLISPKDGETNVSSPVTFGWTSGPGVDFYRLTLRVDGMTREIRALSRLVTLNDLPEGAVVDWDVEATSKFKECLPTRSATSRFTTRRCELGSPQITQPLEGAEFVPSNVGVQWTAVSGAIRYRVTVSDSRGSDIPPLIVTGTSALLTVAQGPVTVTIVAINAEGCESLPAVRKFTSANCVAPLAGPVILAPGEISSNAPYIVSWKAVAGATSYEVLESRPSSTSVYVPGFADDIKVVKGLSAEYVHASTTRVTYFYRVRPILDCNPLLTTPFSTNANVDIIPSGLSTPGSSEKFQPKTFTIKLALDATLLDDPKKAKYETDLMLDLCRAVNIDLSLCPIKIIITPTGGAGEVESATNSVIGTNTTATVTSSVPWLTVTPATITIPPDGLVTVTLTATPGGLPVGTSTGSIIATAPGGSRVTFPVSISLVTPVAQTPKDEPTANSLIIAAVAHVEGVGSLWRSDVRITNTASQKIRYALNFTPSSVDGTQEGKTTEIEIGPGQTTALDDIVRSWYGQGALGDGSNGTLEIRPLDFAGKIGTDGISFVTVASSRSYNETPKGTLGQFVPAIPVASFVGKTTNANQSASLSVQQIAQNASSRTNLGLVEGSGKEANVQITVFNAAGQQVTSFTQLLKPFEHQQLNSFLAVRNITLNDGRVEVKVLSDTGKVMAYASVIDAVTNDPLMVTAVQPSLINANKFVLPGVADFNNGTSSWRTDMRIFNASNAATTATLTFYKQDDANNVPRAINRRIEAGEILVVNDVLNQLFGMKNTGGAVHVTTASNSSLVVTGRTYDQRTSGTFGQFIPAVTESDAVGLGGRSLQVQQLEETDHFRSNLGIAEVSGKPVTVEITAIVPDSLVSPKRQITLQANQFTQLTQVLRSMNLTEVYNGRIALRVISGEGKITAYGSVVDNQTQDPTYVPAQ